MPEWFAGGTLNPAFTPSKDHWLMQWERLGRWHRRVSAIQRRSTQQPLRAEDYDDVIAFVQNCYHLRDWIIASRPELREQMDDLFRSSFHLRACRDICNGFKHKNLHNASVDRAFSIHRTYDYDSVVASREHYHVAFEDSNHELRAFDLFEFCAAAFQTWDTFIHASSLTGEERP